MKISNFLIVLFIICSISPILNAQTISTSLISNGGVVKNYGSLRTEWSIGEIAVQHINRDIKISQGFHQVNQISTSIFDYQLKVEIEIFPNPSSQQIKFSFHSNEILNVEIYNILGQKVMEYKSIQQSNPYEIYQLQAGTYLLKFINNKGQFNLHKLIKV